MKGALSAHVAQVRISVQLLLTMHCFNYKILTGSLRVGDFYSPYSLGAAGSNSASQSIKLLSKDQTSDHFSIYSRKVNKVLNYNTLSHLLSLSNNCEWIFNSRLRNVLIRGMQVLHKIYQNKLNSHKTMMGNVTKLVRKRKLATKWLPKLRPCSTVAKQACVPVLLTKAETLFYHH